MSISINNTLFYICISKARVLFQINQKFCQIISFEGTQSFLISIDVVDLENTS